MKDNFVIAKPMMEQIINELKQIDLCRYDDYVRIVGIVSMLEANLKKSNEVSPEEVITDG